MTIKIFNELTLTELYEIIKLRIETFTLEQKSLYQDLDDLDYLATHVFIKDKDQVIAYLRVIKESNEQVIIGRVIAKNKGLGTGSKLMIETINYLREINVKEIKVRAQVSALNFYLRLGFIISSDEYLIDEIPHLDMILFL